MHSTEIDVFFSCSLQEQDEKLNSFFKSICKAIDINCLTVDTAYDDVAPQVVRKQIENSLALIAVAPKRKQLNDDTYTMPSSIQEEISIAYGLKIPSLLFVEEGVTVDGMKSHYGTHLIFNRETIKDDNNLMKIIKSLHDFKLKIITPNDILLEEDISEFITEEQRLLIELKYNDGEFYWENTMVRKLRFLKDFKRKFPIAFWSAKKSKVDNTNKIEYDIELKSSSKQVKLIEEVERHDSDYLKLHLKIDPYPTKGDFIEYATYVKSKYLNPIFKSDLERETFSLPEDINNKNFFCIDGFIPITRTKQAQVEFRFPREYQVSIDDFEFFCGRFIDEVDYLVESEMNRYTATKEDLGGNKSLKLKIESPLLSHMYGIAWNPPEKNM